MPFLKNLTVLRLNLNLKNFGPSGFSAIVNGIVPLKLSELQLEASINRVGVSGANDLKLLLNSQKNIKKLTLVFEESYWGDMGGKALGEGIAILKAVEDLNIDVSFNGMQDYGSYEIAK